MTTKIRAALLTAFFFFALLNGVQAQTQYEYAIINYTPWFNKIEVSINGVEYKKIIVPKEKIKSNADANAGLEEMNKMIGEGWELFNTTMTNGASANIQIYVFYLRKKKI